MFLINSTSIDTALTSKLDAFDFSMQMINERLLYASDMVKFPGHVHQIAQNGTELVILANPYEYNNESCQVVESKPSPDGSGKVYVLMDVI